MHNFPCKLLTNYRLRIFATGLCILMLVLTVLSAYHYYEDRSRVMEKIDQRLYAGATGLRYAVGDAFHNRKLQPNMSLQEDYFQANCTLAKLTHDLDLKKLYTLISVDDGLYQILSNVCEEPINGGHKHFFALYPDAGLEGAEAHRSAVPRYYDTEDQVGSYRSLLIPYVTAGGYRYLVGASIDISLNHALAETLQRALAQCGILLLLSFPLTALFVWPLLCIDGFKDINHYYGIHVGDQLLISVGRCIKALIPAGTRLYKLDGDEYALLCESSPRSISVDYLISRINEQRINIEDAEFRLSVTAGVAQGTTQLIEHADLALKEAKRVLKPYKHYSSYLHTVQNSQANLLWTYKLKDAIDSDRIEAYFQPIYDNRRLNRLSIKFGFMGCA
ncbi:MAG: hypothetical protein B6I37_04605 [Desulfobacteraceae bacterium 4572_35.2]|nr:MAG: hypothetical protein B6I37_04605 [Desulfobacteraceae bacterium 4572_35.2]